MANAPSNVISKEITKVGLTQKVTYCFKHFAWSYFETSFQLVPVENWLNESHKLLPPSGINLRQDLQTLRKSYKERTGLCIKISNITHLRYKK